MMYHQKMACALKVNGRVLREDGDTVRLPFGSEFEVFVKNMNSVRALVRIEIDGTDIAEGTSFIVPANDSITLERFVKNGNMSQGLRFKFIERTAKIEDGPRGIKSEDGLIRVEYEFEREPTPIRPTYGYSMLRSKSADSFTKSASKSTGDYWNSSPAQSFDAAFGASAAAFDDGMLCSTRSMNFSDSSAAMAMPQAASAPVSDKGITVGGSVSDQQFKQGAWFPTDGVKHVMILRMLGQVGETPVAKPHLVTTKIECPTCGKKNKSNARFCSDCGTGLINV